MGRPPCCDKVGVKKGPWTPEEDIILVSYIQEHGPGNWRAVPTNTGQWERRLQTDIHMARQALCEALSPEKPAFKSEMKPSNGFISYANNNNKNETTTTTIYASSADNIARLLKGWARNSPKSASTTTNSAATTQQSFNNGESTSSEETPRKLGAFESLFGGGGFESFDSSANSDLSQSVSPESSFFQDESKQDLNAHQMPQLSQLEKWLFDDQSTAILQGKDYLSDLKLDESADIF
ncbi:hypothetical protein Patl1_21916 [Pistacia atlantica]|uniref:Uncharacterized protein n=1 Tax=Pistacia atlantica TaxID=434234 RepID=A0ACC1BN17_9ROSI|nr:hypothetical protein Patl1_21916 [Pistacia atlantica]